ncbi:dsDNA nuclease domain-containing protein [Streptomyces hirsutus]|uniref:dsDNA nuclease domain-containing protein n=1 Tax=Streptomyces hirsutus TaxID=35620 RepID=UPI003410EC1A
MTTNNVPELTRLLLNAPAEDSGTDTASRYNFQYQCAARHCIAMLEDATLRSVICEWHTDFILEYSDDTYELASVKHREPELGPWPFSELWDRGGLIKLYERWKESPEVRCRLVTNASMKGGRDSALTFAQACNAEGTEELASFTDSASRRLGCSTDEARAFLKALSVEFNIPDRVSIRAYHIVNTVEPALRAAGLMDIDTASAWDSIVNLVALKSRDFDQRRFSSIRLARPDALTPSSIRETTIERRRVTRQRVVDAILNCSTAKNPAEPQVSNLWTREPSNEFTGRDDVINRIMEGISEENSGNSCQAIVGISGIGKSEVLAQYAWQNSSRYEFVWWVRADSWASTVADLSDFAEEMGLPKPTAAATLNGMKKTFYQRRGLILLDGAPADEDFIRFIPKKSSTKFLISSVDQRWATHVSTLRLEPLSPQAANKLLKSMVPSVPESELTLLNEALGGLPLALKQAASYMSVSGIATRTYIELLRDRAKDLLSRAAPPEHAGLAAALAITLDRLEREHPLPLALLHMLSYVAPQDFPTELFGLSDTDDEVDGVNDISEIVLTGRKSLRDEVSEELERLSKESVRVLQELDDELTLHDCIESLQKFSLVEAQPGGIHCHSLTQALVRQFLPEAKRGIVIDMATELLNVVASLNPIDSQYWPHYRQMLPHFETFISWLEERNTRPIIRLAFCSSISMYLAQVGMHDSSLKYAKKAVSFAEVESSCGIDARLFAHATLAESMMQTDRWIEALEFINSSIQLAEQEEADAGSIAPLVAKRAAVLGLQGEFQAAIHELNHVKRLASEMRDEDGAQRVRRVVAANTANMRREYGDAHGAIVEFSELIAQHSEDDPRNELATLYCNLSLARYDAGDFAAALDASLKAVEIDNEISDGVHAAAARDWNNAGLALMEMEDHVAAAKAFEKALQIHKSLRDVDSTRSLIAEANLARTWTARGEFSKARKMLEEILVKQENVLGANHRDVATTLTNLAVALGNLRLNGDAAKVALRAVKVDIAVYGEKHPELIPDYHNLASPLMELGQYRAALKWLTKAYEIAYEHFGPNHDRVGFCLERLALCQYCVGDRLSAIESIGRCVEIRESRFGPKHWKTKIGRSIQAQMVSGRNPIQVSVDLPTDVPPL